MLFGGFCRKAPRWAEKFVLVSLIARNVLASEQGKQFIEIDLVISLCLDEVSLFVEDIPWVLGSYPLAESLVALEPHPGVLLAVWSDEDVVVTRHIGQHRLA